MLDLTSIKSKIEVFRGHASLSDFFGFSALILGLTLSNTSVTTVKISQIENPHLGQTRESSQKSNKPLGDFHSKKSKIATQLKK